MNWPQAIILAANAHEAMSSHPMKTPEQSEVNVIKNGRNVKPNSVIMTFLDPSFSHPQGVYESIRTYHQQPFRLSGHLARLEHSYAYCFPDVIDLPYKIERVRDWVLDLIRLSKADNQFLKLVATVDDVLVISRELHIDPRVYQGVKAHMVTFFREEPHIKSLTTRTQHYARKLAEENGAYEALLRDLNGFLLEGAFSNLFWVKDGQLFTNRKSVLRGITQAAVVEIAGQKYPVIENFLHSDDLGEIDELFLTQTSRGIVPILQVDSHTIGNGTIGSVTTDLMQRYHQLTQRECSPPFPKNPL
jgi:branched-subunit amino acid aminotransferase/4-amino-4-deoxychorismate lyase